MSLIIILKERKKAEKKLHVNVKLFICFYNIKGVYVKMIVKEKAKIFSNKRIWLINVFIDKLVRIIPKDNNIWLFGAWLGENIRIILNICMNI